MATNQPQLMSFLVHYRGSFINGEIFYSSYERGKPQVFPVNRKIRDVGQRLSNICKSATNGRSLCLTT